MLPETVICYARQSISDADEGEDKDDTLSLQSQRATLRRWCDEQGWHVVAEITDADARGWQEDRPGYQELIRRCQEGGISHVAVWSLDRLARSVRLQENCLHQLTSLGVEVVSYKEPYVSQPLFRQIIGALNEEQTRTISAHVRRAMAERSRRGLPHGHAPWGYVRAEPAGPLIPDPNHPERATWLREAFTRRPEGWGYLAIAHDLTARGIPTPRGHIGWRPETIARMLRNPVYRGATAVGGHVVEAAHPALIDPDLWRRAQTPFATHRRAPRQKATASWLEGRMRHACGEPMFLLQACGHRAASFRCRLASAHKDGVGSPACPHSPRTINAARAEAAAWQAVETTLAALLPVSRVIANARREHRAAGKDRGAAHREGERQIARLLERRANAEALYLASMRDRDWLAAREAEIDTEIARAREALARLPERLDLAAMAATWQEVHDLRDLAARVKPEERGGILADLGVIVVTPGGPPSGRGQQGTIRLALRPELLPYFRLRDAP